MSPQRFSDDQERYLARWANNIRTQGELIEKDIARRHPTAMYHRTIAVLRHAQSIVSLYEKVMIPW